MNDFLKGFCAVAFDIASEKSAIRLAFSGFVRGLTEMWSELIVFLLGVQFGLSQLINFTPENKTLLLKSIGPTRPCLWLVTALIPLART